MNMQMQIESGEEGNSREETDERVHGMGAGSSPSTGRPVPSTPQRRIEQNPRQTVEVVPNLIHYFT